MSELRNVRHEAFARRVAAGQTAAAAAREAGFAPAYAGQTGARLLRRRDVRLRVEELKMEVLKEYSLDWLIGRYERLADGAEAEGQRMEAAQYLDRIARILLPKEGGATRRAAEADTAPTPIAELILKLDERERAEREGRLLEMDPAE